MINLLSEEKKEETDNTVVIAEVWVHLGALHGVVTSGGTIPYKNSVYATRIIPKNNNMGVVQIISKGIDHPIKHERFVRPKIIMEAKEIKGVKSKTEQSQKSLSEEGLY